MYRCNCPLLLQSLSDFVNTLKVVVIAMMRGPCHPSHSSPWVILEFTFKLLSLKPAILWGYLMPYNWQPRHAYFSHWPVLISKQTVGRYKPHELAAGHSIVSIDACCYGVGVHRGEDSPRFMTEARKEACLRSFRAEKVFWTVHNGALRSLHTNNKCKYVFAGPCAFFLYDIYGSGAAEESDHICLVAVSVRHKENLCRIIQKCYLSVERDVFFQVTA